MGIAIAKLGLDLAEPNISILVSARTKDMQVASIPVLHQAEVWATSPLPHPLQQYARSVNAPIRVSEKLGVFWEFPNLVV